MIDEGSEREKWMRKREEKTERKCEVKSVPNGEIRDVGKAKEEGKIVIDESLLSTFYLLDLCKSWWAQGGSWFLFASPLRFYGCFSWYLLKLAKVKETASGDGG